MLYEYRLFHCIHKNGWYLEEIVEDVETRFDTSNYELDRPLPKGKKKKLIGLMTDELGGKIMKWFFRLRTYSCLKVDVSEDDKAKGIKMCVVKRKLKVENQKNCSKETQLQNKKTPRKNKIDLGCLKNITKNS